MNLQDKIIVITGATQGFGRCIALACAREKAHIVACDLSPCDDTVALIEQAGGSATQLQFDICDSSACDNAVSQIIDTFGKIDGLVNNAALYATLTFSPFEMIDAEEWDKVMHVNIKGPWNMCKAVTPFMRTAKSGSIVNIASNTVLIGAPMMAHYIASKSAVIGLSRAIATEVGADNIRVNTVCPGAMNTPGTHQAAGDQLEAIISMVPPARTKPFLEPEEVTGTIVFLLSDASAQMTGQTLATDGGMTSS